MCGLWDKDSGEWNIIERREVVVGLGRREWGVNGKECGGWFGSLGNSR